MSIINPNIYSFYSIIQNYFENPTLYSISDNDEKYTTFSCQISNFTLEKVFLVVRVKKNNLSESPLEKLSWLSFQIRRLSQSSPYDHLPKCHSTYPNKNLIKTIILKKVANEEKTYQIINLPEFKVKILDENINCNHHKEINLFTLFTTYNFIFYLI